MPSFIDKEFGRVTVRRSALASSVKIRVAANGTLSASLPLYAPMFMIKRLIHSSRDELRELLKHYQPPMQFHDGMTIGKSHHLIVRPTTGSLSVARDKLIITVKLPESMDLSAPDVIAAIRDEMRAALRIEAKQYLPRRLKFLAEKLDCSYDRVRFSHASGRWGSCSSQGTISLNIALMKLPHDLIDYVLVHELSHTKHMNHSSEFWRQVALGDPEYTSHRRALKLHTPTI